MKKNKSIIDSALDFFKKEDEEQEVQAFNSNWESNLQMLEKEYEKKL